MLHTQHTVALIKQTVLLLKCVLLDISGHSEAVINKWLCSGNVDCLMGHCLGTVSIILYFNLWLIFCKIHKAQGKFSPRGQKSISYCNISYRKVIAKLFTFQQTQSSIWCRLELSICPQKHFSFCLVLHQKSSSLVAKCFAMSSSEWLTLRNFSRSNNLNFATNSSLRIPHYQKPVKQGYTSIK